MPRRVVPLALLLSATLFVACGLTPKDGDKEYLEEFCRQTNLFSDALVVADDPAAIEAAITTYADSLRDLAPPEDVQEYNDEFVAYVESMLDDPTAALEADAPELDAEVQRRLDAQADGISTCKSTSYFGQ